MTNSGAAHGFWRKPFRQAWVMLALCLASSCGLRNSNEVQGYVEGQFVYVASPIAGTLESLRVQRGAQVKAGDPLFTLESALEMAAREEASGRLAQSRANLEDTKKGKRPSEIQSLDAQLKQACAAQEFSEREFARQEKLIRAPGAIAEQDLDRARAIRNQDGYRVAQLEADQKTARLGAREDVVSGAEAEVRAREAALAKAEWDLSQKRRNAPQAGMVFDTLYREGEWIAAGRPVIALLPPQNMKVRAFVPETRMGSIHIDDRVRVIVDGAREPVMGKISFISPQAEYTPPVIYSRENRSKLVFLVEMVFDSETAAKLHPGQPVDVQFGF